MGKRPLNDYFKTMLKAKKNKSKSFTYKGKKYVGSEHPLLGMIYKKSTTKSAPKTKKRRSAKKSADKCKHHKKIKKVMKQVLKEERESLQVIKKAVKLLKEDQSGG